MTALILQSRLDSTRLDQKALLPLGGKPLVLRTMEALKTVKADVYVLACPVDSRSTFAPLAKEAGFQIVAGSKENVLERYCDAIRLFNPDRIIRATGDNPFVFADAADTLHKEASLLGADYSGYAYIPYGAGVESVKAAALLRAEQEAMEPRDKEHVCPYLYGNPGLFSLHRPLPPLEWQHPEVKISVDTKEDYEKAQLLYEALHGKKQDRNPYHGKTVIKKYMALFAP